MDERDRVVFNADFRGADENGMWYPLYRGNPSEGPENDPVPIGHVFIAHNTIDDLEESASFRMRTMFGSSLIREVADDGTAWGDDCFIVCFLMTPDYDEREGYGDTGS